MLFTTLYIEQYIFGTSRSVEKKVNDKLDLSDQLLHQNKMILTLKPSMYLYGAKVPKSAYCSRSLSVHQWVLCEARSCRSLCVCYFEDNLSPRHPATCKFRIPAPSTTTAATSVDKNSIICTIFTGCKHIESHLLLCLPSDCFCTPGVNFGQWRRFS